jgi:4-hydroxybenzoate polyprenyltransferase
MKNLAEYLVLIRFPGLGGLAIPPVIAALTVGSVDVISLSLLFFIGVCVSVFGFVLNDYIDVEVDRLSKDLQSRPLVSGTVTKQVALAICFLFMVLAFLTFFILFYGKVITYLRFLSVLCILIAWVLGSIYNIYGKKIFASDILVAISLSLIFLIGAFALDTQPTLFTWIVFILTFNNLFYMNAIQGGIKDADHDILMNVNNIALRSGVNVKQGTLFIPPMFKLLGLAIKTSSIILLFSPFLIFNQPYSLLQILVLILGSIGVVYINIKLLCLREFKRDIIRKYISIESFLRYSLVPIMLFSFIGVVPALIIMFFPMIWYVVFTPLTGVKLLKPRM